MVWCNGNLAGGWPYGYNSFRVDLTPYLKPGGDNQVAIRLDNPNHSSRWYPGGGLYRNVWLVKVNPVHVAQWGTFISTRDVSAGSATIDLALFIQNNSKTAKNITVVTDVYLADDKTGITQKKVATFPGIVSAVEAGEKGKVEQSRQKGAAV